MTLKANHAFHSIIADDPTAAGAGEVLPSHWNADHPITGTADATQLPATVPLAVTNDTNITGSITAQTLTLSWVGELGLARGGTNADLSATGGTHSFLKQASVGGAITVAQPTAADISGLATIFSFEGDSLSDVAGVGTWPLNLASSFAFFNRGTTHNFASNGDTAANMVSEYASQAGAVPIAVGQEAYFFLWAGRNDINALTSAATIYGYLTTLWAAARASGYKVCAFTIMPGLDTTGVNTIRVALNALIRADATVYDYLVDTDLYFVDPNEPSLRNLTFGGGGHLSPAGNAMLAQRVAAKILGVEPVPSAPRDAYDINLALNSAMDIDQRNAGNAVTGLTAGAGAYITDGYKVIVTGPSVVTAQQVADAPPGLSKSLKLTVTTAEASLAAGSLVRIVTMVEQVDTARLIGGALNSRPITIGFFTKTHRTGNYSACIVDGAGARAYPFTFTQNNVDTWEYKTAIIPGDIAGAWGAGVNGAGLFLLIVMAAGSTWQAAANTWNTGGQFAVTGSTNGVAATSDVFQVTAPVILPTSINLLAEHIPRILRPVSVELHNCQRRFCSSFPYGTMPADDIQSTRYIGAAIISTNVESQRILFPRRMRVDNPTITLYSSNEKASPTAGLWQYFNNSGAWVDGIATATASVKTDGFVAAVTGTMTAQGAYLLGGNWKADADF